MSRCRCGFELIEPVEAHCLDDAITNDDKAGVLAAGEMLVNGEGRHVNEIPPLPFEAFRLSRPVPDEGVNAVKFQIPMQVVPATLDDKNNLFPHVPVLAGALAWLQKLHIGLDAALLTLPAHQRRSTLLPNPFDDQLSQTKTKIAITYFLIAANISVLIWALIVFSDKAIGLGKFGSNMEHAREEGSAAVSAHTD